MHLIEWRDSRGVTSEWELLEETKDFHACSVKSLGWIIYQDEHEVRLASNIEMYKDEDKRVVGVIVIPKCSIEKMTPISFPKIPESREAKESLDEDVP